MGRGGAPRGLAAARAVLKEQGLLLETDPRIRSVASLVAGGPVRGSWWAHPAGKAIYRALGTLLSSRDVVSVPLAYGKGTLVHRWLWPALLAIATAERPWQTRGLSAPARRLLAHVRREGEARSDRLPSSLRLEPSEVGDLVRDLERRLCLRGESFHTEKGAPATRLETWERWARAQRVRSGLPLGLAAAPFEVTALGWWAATGGRPMRWPWPWPQGSLYDLAPRRRGGKSPARR
jgi:hypothetical protein